MKKNKAGFTLIEIIVVIFIIGTISSFVIVSFSNPRQKNRDIKRISDITQLQMALNTYYQFEGDYPESLVAGEPLIGSSTETVFLQSVPENPAYPDDDCTFSDYNYSYNSEDERYNIDFCLEGPLDNYSPGSKCAIPEDILDHECDICGGETSVTYEGYDYNIVIIGSQCWFAENLQTTKYNDGEDIPNIASSTEWGNDTEGAYVWYDNDETSYGDYGALYNWYAVDTGKLCPDGWHIPSDDEFKILEGTVDSTYGVDDDEWDNTGYRGTDAGSQLAGEETLWGNGDLISNSNFGDSGFNALPAGYRLDDGDFYSLGSYTFFWSSLDVGSDDTWNRSLYSTHSSVSRHNYDKGRGFSVRCLKD
jgi:uncharacterized protein (TIGR02145 family)/prepilin-type N-terminal cleavage/methylation domain-containing protein